MRIIEPIQLNLPKSAKKAKRRRLKSKLIVVFLMIFLGVSLWSCLRPLPAPSGKELRLVSAPQTVNITWPRLGQAAITAKGYGILGASARDQKAVPIASTAKIMTALAVLKAHPLNLGQEGPTITITRADEKFYDNYLSENGTVVPVRAGETISEFQALEAMLLPSANNIADSLATWAFGSVEDYTTYANNLAKNLGLNSAHFADASGFSPQTVANARDMAVLAQTAMDNPVIAQIVGQKTANVSVVGTVKNTNFLLGRAGTFGIKTGNTDQAKGCFVFAAKRQVQSHEITFYGSILGESNTVKAINDSVEVVDSAAGDFTELKTISAGQKVGYYTTAWGDQVAATAAGNLSSFGWPGSSVTAQITLDKLSGPAGSGQIVGKVSVGGQTTEAVLANSISQPSIIWRAFRWIKI